MGDERLVLSGRYDRRGYDTRCILLALNPRISHPRRVTLTACANLLRCKPARAGKALSQALFRKGITVRGRIISHSRALSCWCGEYFQGAVPCSGKVGLRFRLRPHSAAPL
jgi:hypothetical protein